MTIYLVDVHDDIHTCPADATPHVIATRRRLVSVTVTGLCQAPVTIRIAGVTTTARCGRHEPYDRQCVHCRTVVWTRYYTITDLGYQPGVPGIPDTGTKPCRYCGTPVAAFLDAHILCTPAAGRRAA